MPTTVHIPAELLRRVDRRAKALGSSRNRWIVEAIDASLGSRGEWPPELVHMLSVPLGREAAAMLESSLARVMERRANRKPPRL
ncbi:MAG: ribbon-helix-helix protein, CopG family [Polyangiaceae bacterium]